MNTPPTSQPMSGSWRRRWSLRPAFMKTWLPAQSTKKNIPTTKPNTQGLRENAKEAIRALKDKLSDVLENRSERNRWISHFTQFSTMETLDRKAVVHMIQSIKVIGKKELEITFTYQDEYQKAIQLIQLAEKTSQRKVG